MQARLVFSTQHFIRNFPAGFFRDYFVTLFLEMLLPTLWRFFRDYEISSMVFLEWFPLFLKDLFFFLRDFSSWRRRFFEGFNRNYSNDWLCSDSVSFPDQVLKKHANCKLCYIKEIEFLLNHTVCHQRRCDPA